ncbi:uncharacterized protein LOC131889491 [Tigriopus californicus]|uniref:uncharacterized protein LOC131889491 n=1 Tax=Tigriopus californicus TaxID=6832 RepID=UPI0027DA8547|nr:uncharacterized protein LOC131889491 [Tigriopus californicus]
MLALFHGALVELRQIQLLIRDETEMSSLLIPPGQKSDLDPPLAPDTTRPAMDPVTLAALVIIVALATFICTVMGKVCFDRVLAVRNQNFCAMASSGHVPSCRNCHTPVYLNPPSSASHPRSRSIHRIEHEEDTPSMHGPSLPALLLPKMLSNATADSTTFQRLGIASGDGKGTVLGLPDFAERLENQHLSPMPNTPPVFRHNSDEKGHTNSDSFIHPVWSPSGGPRFSEATHGPDSESTSVSASQLKPPMGLSDSNASQQRVKYISPNDERMLITPQNARESRQETTCRMVDSRSLDESFILRIPGKSLAQQVPSGVKYLAQFKAPRGSPGNTGPVPPRSVVKGSHGQPQALTPTTLDSDHHYEIPSSLIDPPTTSQNSPPTETITEMMHCQFCGWTRPFSVPGRSRSLSDLPDENAVIEVPVLLDGTKNGLKVRPDTMNGSETSEVLDKMFATPWFKPRRVIKTRYTHLYDGQARVASPKEMTPQFSTNQDKELPDEVFSKPPKPL